MKPSKSIAFAVRASRLPELLERLFASKLRHDSNARFTEFFNPDVEPEETSPNLN